METALNCNDIKNDKSFSSVKSSEQIEIKCIIIIQFLTSIEISIKQMIYKNMFSVIQWVIELKFSHSNEKEIDVKIEYHFPGSQFAHT